MNENNNIKGYNKLSKDKDIELINLVQNTLNDINNLDITNLSINPNPSKTENLYKTFIALEGIIQTSKANQRILKKNIIEFGINDHKICEIDYLVLEDSNKKIHKYITKGIWL